MATSVLSIVAKNVRQLVAVKKSRPNFVKGHEKHIDVKTVERLEKMDLKVERGKPRPVIPRIEVLGAVADAAGVQAWQLLHPTMGDTSSRSIQATLLAEHFDSRFQTPETRQIAYAAVTLLIELGPVKYAQHLSEIAEIAKQAPPAAQGTPPAGARSGSSSRRTE